MIQEEAKWLEESISRILKELGEDKEANRQRLYDPPQMLRSCATLYLGVVNGRWP